MDAGQDLAQHAVDLDPRDMLTEAHVRPGTECDVSVGRAADVEAVRIGKPPLVVIGRAEIAHDLVAGTDLGNESDFKDDADMGLL